MEQENKLFSTQNINVNELSSQFGEILTVSDVDGTIYGHDGKVNLGLAYAFKIIGGRNIRLMTSTPIREEISNKLGSPNHATRNDLAKILAKHDIIVIDVWVEGATSFGKENKPRELQPVGELYRTLYIPAYELLNDKEYVREAEKLESELKKLDRKKNPEEVKKLEEEKAILQRKVTRKSDSFESERSKWHRRDDHIVWERIDQATSFEIAFPKNIDELKNIGSQFSTALLFVLYPDNETVDLWIKSSGDRIIINSENLKEILVKLKLGIEPLKGILINPNKFQNDFRKAFLQDPAVLEINKNSQLPLNETNSFEIAFPKNIEELKNSQSRFTADSLVILYPDDLTVGLWIKDSEKEIVINSKTLRDTLINMKLDAENQPKKDLQISFMDALLKDSHVLEINSNSQSPLTKTSSFEIAFPKNIVELKNSRRQFSGDSLVILYPDNQTIGLWIKDLEKEIVINSETLRDILIAMKLQAEIQQKKDLQISFRNALLKNPVVLEITKNSELPLYLYLNKQKFVNTPVLKGLLIEYFFDYNWSKFKEQLKKIKFFSYADDADDQLNAVRDAIAYINKKYGLNIRPRLIKLSNSNFDDNHIITMFDDHLSDLEKTEQDHYELSVICVQILENICTDFDRCISNPTGTFKDGESSIPCFSSAELDIIHKLGKAFYHVVKVMSKKGMLELQGLRVHRCTLQKKYLNIVDFQQLTSDNQNNHIKISQNKDIAIPGQERMNLEDLIEQIILQKQEEFNILNHIWETLETEYPQLKKLENWSDFSSYAIKSKITVKSDSPLACEQVKQALQNLYSSLVSMATKQNQQGAKIVPLQTISSSAFEELLKGKQHATVSALFSKIIPNINFVELKEKNPDSNIAEPTKTRERTKAISAGKGTYTQLSKDLNKGKIPDLETLLSSKDLPPVVSTELTVDTIKNNDQSPKTKPQGNTTISNDNSSDIKEKEFTL